MTTPQQDANSTSDESCVKPVVDVPPMSHNDMLERVKTVSQRIVERVRKALDETALDTPSLPSNPTVEMEVPRPDSESLTGRK